MIKKDLIENRDTDTSSDSKSNGASPEVDHEKKEISMKVKGGSVKNINFSLYSKSTVTDLES